MAETTPIVALHVLCFLSFTYGLAILEKPEEPGKPLEIGHDGKSVKPNGLVLEVTKKEQNSDERKTKNFGMPEWESTNKGDDAARGLFQLLDEPELEDTKKEIESNAKDNGPAEQGNLNFGGRPSWEVQESSEGHDSGASQQNGNDLGGSQSEDVNEDENDSVGEDGNGNISAEEADESSESDEADPNHIIPMTRIGSRKKSSSSFSSRKSSSSLSSSRKKSSSLLNKKSSSNSLYNRRFGAYGIYSRG